MKSILTCVVVVGLIGAVYPTAARADTNWIWAPYFVVVAADTADTAGGGEDDWDKIQDLRLDPIDIDLRAGNTVRKNNSRFLAVTLDHILADRDTARVMDWVREWAAVLDTVTSNGEVTLGRVAPVAMQCVQWLVAHGTLTTSSTEYTNFKTNMGKLLYGSVGSTPLEDTVGERADDGDPPRLWGDRDRANNVGAFARSAYVAWARFADDGTLTTAQRDSLAAMATEMQDYHYLGFDGDVLGDGFDLDWNESAYETTTNPAVNPPVPITPLRPWSFAAYPTYVDTVSALKIINDNYTETTTIRNHYHGLDVGNALIMEARRCDDGGNSAAKYPDSLICTTIPQGHSSECDSHLWTGIDPLMDMNVYLTHIGETDANLWGREDDAIQRAMEWNRTIPNEGDGCELSGDEGYLVRIIESAYPSYTEIPSSAANSQEGHSWAWTRLVDPLTFTIDEPSIFAVKSAFCDNGTRKVKVVVSWTSSLPGAAEAKLYYGSTNCTGTAVDTETVAFDGSNEYTVTLVAPCATGDWSYSITNTRGTRTSHVCDDFTWNSCPTCGCGSCCPPEGCELD